MRTIDASSTIRLEKIRKSLLLENKCTHYLFSDTIDIQYLSSFHSSNIYCLISKKKNILFSDFRYAEAGKTFCSNNATWIFVLIKQNEFAFLTKHIPPKSVVGFQSESMTVDQFTKLKAAIKQVRFEPLSRKCTDVLLPKTPDELHYIKKAAQIADAAFAALLKRIKLGMTEKQVALFLDDYCKNHGSQQPSFDTIVLFGKRAALPHGTPSDVALKKGDWILCDFGCTVEGFCSDMTRTFVFGKASRLQKHMYVIVLKAQRAGIATVMAGVTGKKVDKVTRNVIEKAGYAKMFGHGTGHGVGRRIHENPRLNKREEERLLSGTVVTVEPGIYDTSFGGVRIEDMVVVLDNGCDIITQSPKELLEVGCNGF